MKGKGVLNEVTGNSLKGLLDVKKSDSPSFFACLIVKFFHKRIEERNDRAKTEGTYNGSKSDDSAKRICHGSTDDIRNHTAPEIGDRQVVIHHDGQRVIGGNAHICRLVGGDSRADDQDADQHENKSDG